MVFIWKHLRNKILILIFFLILGLAVTSHATNDLHKYGEANIKKSVISQGNSSFQIAIRIPNPTVDQGDPFQMEIYISGYGNVTEGKLTIFFPAGFIDEKNKGEIRVTVRALLKVPIDNTVGMTVSKLDPLIFQRISPERELQIYGEVENPQGAPIVIDTRVSPVCNLGDHKFKVILSWNDGSSWQTTQDSATVHVRSWEEKLGSPIAITLTVIIVCYNSYTNLTEIWKRDKRKAIGLAAGVVGAGAFIIYILSSLR